MFASLMTDVLGYERFATHSSDFGGIVTSQLGHKYADRIIASHTTAPGVLTLWNGERPWDLIGAPPHSAPEDIRRALIDWQAGVAAHVAVHVLDPQSLAYGPHDSPAALAAWFLVRRYKYSDCRGSLDNSFSRDDLCSLLTLYWATESFVTSVRYYRETSLHQWRPSHAMTPVVQAPTGVSHFLPEMPAALADPDQLALYFNLVYFNRHERGGHFAAAEAPEAVVAGILATVAAAR